MILSSHFCRPWLYICTAALLFLLLLLGPWSERAFTTRGEGREALVVSAMYNNNSLILPFRNGVIPSKPPLFHWLAYYAAKVKGNLDEDAIRLPSVLGAEAVVIIFCVFLYSITHSAMTAWLTAGILATSFEFIRSASHARVDMVFTLGLTVAFIGLYKLLSALELNWKGLLRSLLIALVGGVWAVLAKGPAGLLLPLVAATALALLTAVTSPGFKPAKAACWLGGFCVAVLVVGSLWYYLAYLEGGRAFLEKQLLGENIARVVDMTGFNPGHKKPFFYSIVELMVGFLPWSVFLPAVVTFFVSNWRELLSEERRFLAYSLIWSLMFLAAVSVSSSKREVYLLPIFPQLAYILSHTILNYKKKLLVSTIPAVVVLPTAFAVAVAALAPHFVSAQTVADTVFLKQQDRLYFYPLYEAIAHRSVTFSMLLVSFLLFFSATTFLKLLTVKGSLSLIASMALITSLVAVVFQPAAAEVASPKEFMEEVITRVDAQDAIFQFRDDFYSAVFYAGRDIPFTAGGEELRSHEHGYLLGKSKDMSDVFRELPNAKVVAQSDNLAANGRDKLVLFRYGE